MATNAAATSRVPCFELRIAWGRTTWPTDWATQSSDETARCMNYGYSRKISIDPSEVGSEKPAELSITLNNQDQRYSAFNTSSAITASILGSTTTAGGATVTYPKLQGSPVRLREGYTDATNGDRIAELATYPGTVAGGILIVAAGVVVLFGPDRPPVSSPEVAGVPG